MMISKRTGLIISLVLSAAVLVGCSKKEETNIESNKNVASNNVEEEKKDKQEDKKENNEEINEDKDKDKESENEEDNTINTESIGENIVHDLVEQEPAYEESVPLNEQQSQEPVDVALQLYASMFIPNGSYELRFSGSDAFVLNQSVKGNGSAYQVFGYDSKGYKISVYSLLGGELYKTYEAYLSDDEVLNINSTDYFSKSNMSEVVLNGNISVGSRWDNKEIVEIGENLNLGNITLTGAYVKTWEKYYFNDSEFVETHYYSEGLGCVKTTKYIDGVLIENAYLTEL